MKVLSFDSVEHNNYQYVVVETGPDFPVSRDRLLEALRAENILARRYFWPGCHRMAQFANDPTYRKLDLPNTDLVAGKVIVLPTGSAVTPSYVSVICAVIQMLAAR